MKRRGHLARKPPMRGGTTSAERIAIFLPTLGGGGAERVAITLAESFAGRGYPTDLVLSIATGPLLANVPASVRVVDLRSQRLWTSLLPLIRYRWRNRPAVVLSLMPLANALNVISAGLAPRRCRTVLSEHTSRSIAMDRDMSNAGPRLLYSVCRWAYPKADAIIAVSSGVAERLRAQLPRAAGAVIAVHNPVPPPEAERKGKEAKHPWLGDPDTPCLVAMGRLEAEKDPVTMLLVLDALREDRPVRLLWLGDGSMRGSMEQRRTDLGLDDNVEFLGFREDRLAFLSQADAFLMTSRCEGFGNVIVEALGLGVPVVSTDCPGPAEILDEGRYGELVAVGDVHALAAAVLEVLDHPPDAERLRARSRDFDVETVADRYLEVLGV